MEAVYTIEAEKKFALDSHDHTNPAGVYDTSSSVSFNFAILEKYPEAKILDIGCAGGSLVESFVIMGNEAVGVEGSPRAFEENSDLPAHRRRDHSWLRIPNNLFNCDATKPFQIFRDGEPAKFEIISNWEFFEHIEQSDLEGVFDNIAKHIVPGGCIVGSIADYPDEDHHRNIQGVDWWIDKFVTKGYKIMDETFFNGPWVRGRGLWKKERKILEEGFNYLVIKQ